MEAEQKEQVVEEKNGSILETVVAILIAIVTVLSAVVAWRSSVADDAAGDADVAGIRASINAEETRALNYVNAYENYGSFTTYKRYNDLGDLILKDMENVSEEEAGILESQRSEAHDLAAANKFLFPNKFLNRDGSYGLQRQLGEMWADAAKEKDLNPDPQFVDADKNRSKANYLLLTVTIMALGLVLYTLVETVEDKSKLLLTILGSVLAVIGAIAALLIELKM